MSIINLHGKDIDVDDEMGPVILELNRLGLRTVSCCAGHLERERPLAQLCFNIHDCSVYINDGMISINWRRIK